MGINLTLTIIINKIMMNKNKLSVIEVLQNNFNFFNFINVLQFCLSIYFLI